MQKFVAKIYCNVWIYLLTDGQIVLPRISSVPATEEPSIKSHWGINNVSPIMLRKRTYEQNGNSLSAGFIHLLQVGNIYTGSPVPLKRRQLAPPSILAKAVPDFYGSMARNALMNPLNGRAKVATITRIGGRKQMISWVDAPDDVYFVATDSTRYNFANCETCNILYTIGDHF